MNGLDLELLRPLLEKLPAGPWEVQTSCSFRRIGSQGKDGNVLHGTVQRSDGMPDLSMSERELQALCDLRNAVAEMLGVDHD